jgi:hypothetical protein
MHSFSEHLYASFTRINGWLFGTVGLVVSVGAFFFGPDTKVVVGWLVALAAVASVFLGVLSDAAYSGWKSSRQALPGVRKALVPPQNYPGIVKVLIVDSSDLFGVDALVSIYVKEDEYERLLAIGRVLTIQTNGFLQVGLTNLTDMDAETEKKLDANDAALLKRLLIKPSIPSYVLQENS